MAGKNDCLYIIKSLDIDSSHLSAVIPDEKHRHLDPEGGYEDPNEVRIALSIIMNHYSTYKTLSNSS